MTTTPAHIPDARTRFVPAQRGLGIAILAVTGLITAQGIVLGVAAATGNPYAYLPGANFPFDSSGGVGLLGMLAWLLVAHWMATVGRAASANGYWVMYRPWVAWWGWVIPIWNLWAPYRYMKAATQGFPVRHLGWWWATWLLATLALVSSGDATTVNGVAVQTSTLTSAPFNAIALTVSWLLFARIVWTVSQGSAGTYAGGATSTTPLPWLP
ncbi:MAG: hypothetical protein HGA51_08990 [Demequinaceae bacterium]|nr:hypothetical protein [Demequinaceae bacterium]